jgi:hypothetical protein
MQKFQFYPYHGAKAIISIPIGTEPPDEKTLYHGMMVEEEWRLLLSLLSALVLHSLSFHCKDNNSALDADGGTGTNNDWWGKHQISTVVFSFQGGGSTGVDDKDDENDSTKL